jgi:hypothetical protein
MPCVSIISVTATLRGLLRALDRGTRGGVEIGHRARDRGGGRGARIVDRRSDLVAALLHRLREGHALLVDRLHRALRDALDLGRELLPCAPKVLRNTPVFSSSTRFRSLPRWLMVAVSSSPWR